MSETPPSSAVAPRAPGPSRLTALLRPAVFAPACITLVIAAGIWQIVALHNPFAIPTLGKIASELADHPGQYVSNGAITLEEMAVGLSVSVTVAFLLAVAMTEVRLLERAIMPIAVALNVTPVVSFAPGLVILFNFGLLPRFIVAAIVVFFPFLVNAMVGLRSVDPEAVDFLHTVHASRLEVLFRLRLPSSLPYLFAALRICVPLSLVGAVVAEFTASGSAGGLGSAIVVANAYSDLPAVYAGVGCLALIGLVASGLVVLVERRLLVWHWSSAPRLH